MFGKHATNRSKKDKTSKSTPMERCEPPKVSPGEGGSLRRRRESPITPARVSFAETSRNFNDQSEIGDVSYTLQIIDDDTGRRHKTKYPHSK